MRILALLCTLLLSQLPLLAFDSVVVVKDINPSSFTALNRLTPFNGILIFTADMTGSGLELWKSDGTESGTVMIKDIRPGSFGSEISEIVAIGNVVYFNANDGVNGNELWKSDGTESGTVMVKNIRADANSSSPNTLFNFNGTLLFVATDGVNGPELWRSDGSDAGTTLVGDLNAGTVGSSPSSFVTYNNKAYFVALSSTGGREIWVTDGTTIGTSQFTDFKTGSDDGVQINAPILVSGGFLFFPAITVAEGVELWMSDGTALNTKLVKDINPGLSSSFPEKLRDMNGTLFFVANDGTLGGALWKTDGTENGTVLVKDVYPDASISGIGESIVYKNALYFFDFTPESSAELWRSDGTPGGTALFKEISAGTGSGAPGNFAVINDTLYFNANDGTSGVEPWKSDGTPSGTVRIQDVKSGVGNGTNAPRFTLAGTMLFLIADDGVHGEELCKIVTIIVQPPEITSATTASTTANVAFSYTITATNTPTSYGASGLPAGLTLNATSGLISGTPTEIGTSTVSLSATNEGGTATASLTLTVLIEKPKITSFLSAAAFVNQPFTYTITATNSPTSFNATDLPAGLSVNTTTGVISGTPTTVGTFYPYISATNSSGTSEFPLLLLIDSGLPEITSALAVESALSSPFSFTIKAKNKPTLAVTGLPAGFAFDATTGVISGTPAKTGSFTVAITATNAIGTINSKLIITIVPRILGEGTNSNKDRDNDGYPDELEQLLAAITGNAFPTPFNAQAGPPEKLTVTKLLLKLNYNPNGATAFQKDALTLSGTVPVTENFKVADSPVAVSIGGIIFTTELDAKGTGTDDEATFKFKIKSSKGTVPQQTAPFTITIKNTNLSSALVDEGYFGGEDAKNEEHFIPINLIFNGKNYRTDLKMSFTVKADSAGQSKNIK